MLSPTLEHESGSEYPWPRELGSPWVVVPVNIGWDSHGENNMGAGLALAAMWRWPDLPALWGGWCRRAAERGEEGRLVGLPERALILFPVKPLVSADPARSWDQLADLALIARSADQLCALLQALPAVHVVLPHVGCGNGGRSIAEVDPILHGRLTGGSVRRRVTLWSLDRSWVGE